MAVSFESWDVFKVVGNNPCAEKKGPQQLEASPAYWLNRCFFPHAKAFTFLTLGSV